MSTPTTGPDPPSTNLRLLILGGPSSGKLTFLQTLTSSLPPLPPPPAPHSGLAHSYTLKTQYYTATLPIWIDELPTSAPELHTWATEFCGEEAKEVRDALGGIVYVFREDSAVETVKRELDALGTLVAKLGWEYGGSGDGVGFVVRMPAREKQADRPVVDNDRWEEVCEPPRGGWEYVVFEDVGRNEYGEPVGMERIREGLEANDWGVGGPGAGPRWDDEGGEYDLDEEDELWGNDEMEKELEELTRVILGDEERRKKEGIDLESAEIQEDEVEKFEAMAMRLQGIRLNRQRKNASRKT